MGRPNIKTTILIVFLFFIIHSLSFSALASNGVSFDLGKKRVVLSGKSSKDDKNLLKQEMFYSIVNGTLKPCENTVFVIQKNFELAEDITVPSGSVLEFDGGSISNGTINTNGCIIKADLYQVFNNIKFNTISTYNGSLEAIDNINVKVLKANSFINKKTNTVINANSIVNRRYVYRITGKNTSPKVENNAVTITANNQKYTVADITSDKKYKLKYDYTRIIAISNATGEMVSGTVKSLSSITFYFISPLTYSKNSVVKNKEIQPEWFGAKGDNNNDDSYAFNSALDLAYYSDSKVIVGNGVYKIDDALVIHTHTNLVGVVPTVEHPVKGCFSVNTDVAMLVFDQLNPTGSYNLDGFGFTPFSNKYQCNYTGIKIYHSQNHARISNVGFYYPKTGIEIDAIGGVQLLRCEDISLWGEENKGVVALSSRCRLGGWFNSNYFRPAFIARSAVIKCEGGGNNTLDGGSCETNSFNDFLIDLDKNASLIVRGGLYKETGRIAKLRNSSLLILEGESYFYGNIDCDETSYVSAPSRNLQSRREFLNNSVIHNDVVIAHYKVFPKKSKLWYETIGNKVVKPLELNKNYEVSYYNGRLFSTGLCRLPMGGIDINGKTIAIRVVSPTAFTSLVREYPFFLNAGNKRSSAYPQIEYSQSRTSLEKTSKLYAPGDVSCGEIERGERIIFLPSQQKKYILDNIVTSGNSSFMISDIYIIDKDFKEIRGNEELRVLDIISYLDSGILDEGFLYGYNKGQTKERPTDLTKEDEGFEFFDTTLHKPIYWTGDTSIGDKGWVDVLGKYPVP